jgi:GTP:adenosylcobinamide-phosphate guanylyltransferase
MSRSPSQPDTVIVLAGQRFGVVNPLAERAGVSHKCLVPICGKPLLLHVLEALAAVPDIAEVRIALDAPVHEEVAALLADYPNVRLIESKPSLADSVLAAAAGAQGRLVVTTADNVLLTPAAVAQVRGAMDRVEAVFGLARKADVHAAHPEGQRGFYRFRDDEYANCNIYGLAGPKALKAVEVFRGGGQFMSSVRRMIESFGLLNIVLLRLGALTREAAARRLGRRLGLTVEATVFDDGALAIDVDNERTYRVCEELLPGRGTAKRGDGDAISLSGITGA